MNLQKKRITKKLTAVLLTVILVLTNASFAFAEPTGTVDFVTEEAIGAVEETEIPADEEPAEDQSAATEGGEEIAAPEGGEEAAALEGSEKAAALTEDCEEAETSLGTGEEPEDEIPEDSTEHTPWKSLSGDEMISGGKNNGTSAEKSNVNAADGSDGSSDGNGTAGGDGSSQPGSYAPGEIIIGVRGGLAAWNAAVAAGKLPEDTEEDLPGIEENLMGLRENLPGTGKNLPDTEGSAAGTKGTPVVTSLMQCDLTEAEYQEITGGNYENNQSSKGTIDNASADDGEDNAISTGSGDGSAQPEEELLGAPASDEIEILLIKTAQDADIEDLSGKLMQMDCVEFAQPDYYRELQAAESYFVQKDPRLMNQWAVNGHSPYGMGLYTSDDPEETSPVWETPGLKRNLNPGIGASANTPKDAIIVAVMDTGLEAANPEIKPVVWNASRELQEELDCGKHGFNAAAYASGGDYTDTSDIHGHGTHCAGIIGAAWDNKGIYGVAHNPKIMSVRIGDENGAIRDSYIVAGYQFLKNAVAKGVNVVAVNDSWGGNYSGYAIERAITELGVMGTLSVFAAGNETENIDDSTKTGSCMNSNPYVVVVNAHDENGELAVFSNYGTRTTHISAPGVSIESAAARVISGVQEANAQKYIPIKDDHNKSLYANFDVMTEDEDDDTVFHSGNFRLSSDDAELSQNTANKLTGANSLQLEPSGSPVSVSLRLSMDVRNVSKKQMKYTAFRLTTDQYRSVASYKIRVTGYVGDNTAASYEATYSANGSSVLVSLPGITNLPDSYLIQITANPSAPQLPGNFYIDDILVTQYCSAYIKMSGTSMATPMVVGEAAVLAGLFATASNAERAMEIRARILGSAEPFRYKEDRNKNLTGGYANLYKAAVLKDYSPVLSSAGWEEGTITVNGYFFGAHDETEYPRHLYLDDREIDPDLIAWNAGALKSSVSFPAEDLESGEHKISIILGSYSSLTGEGYMGRAYFTFDTGSQPEYRMQRLPMAGSDTEFLDNDLGGMCALNDKLYALTRQTAPLNQDCSFRIWQYDLGKNDGWKRLNHESIRMNGRVPDSISNLIAFEGRLIFFTEFCEEETGRTKLAMVCIDPAGETSTEIKSLDNYTDRKINAKGLLAGAASDRILLFEFDNNKQYTTVRVLRSEKKGGTIRITAEHEKEMYCPGQLFYGDNDELYYYGAPQSPSGTGPKTVYRCDIDETKMNLEQICNPNMFPTLSASTTQTQSMGVVGIKNGFMATGIRNGYGKDTYIYHGLDKNGTGSVVPYYANDAKMFNIFTLTYKGKYYVLADTRSDMGIRRILSVMDLAAIGEASVANPADTEKKPTPVPTPTPTPGGGGGGSTKKSTALPFSQNWFADSNGQWKIRNSAGAVVTNAWLCDDAVMANGQNVWYLLGSDGSMLSYGLVRDNSGNYYSLEMEHNGRFGMLRYRSGYYDVNGTRVYLEFEQSHTGSFAAIKNADGIEKLREIYGVKTFNIGNQNLVYTSKF